MGDDTIKRNISKNISKYREACGMSQKELAQRLGVVPSRISNWETGANCPTIDILFEVCEILGVSINDIYGVYPESRFVLQYDEQEIIKKYRALDPHGREMVDFTLQKEWERSTFYENIDEVEKYKRAKKYYDSVLANKKNVTLDDLVAPFPDEDAPPKTLSQLADDWLNAAHAIENASKEDKNFDDDIMDDDNF